MILMWINYHFFRIAAQLYKILPEIQHDETVIELVFDAVLSILPYSFTLTHSACVQLYVTLPWEH